MSVYSGSHQCYDVRCVSDDSLSIVSRMLMNLAKSFVSFETCTDVWRGSGRVHVVCVLIFMLTNEISAAF